MMDELCGKLISWRWWFKLRRQRAFALHNQTEQPVIFIIWSPFSSLLLVECLSRMPAIHPSPLNDHQLCYLKTTHVVSSSAIIVATIKQTLLPPSQSLCHHRTRKTRDNNLKSIRFNLYRTCEALYNAYYVDEIKVEMYNVRLELSYNVNISY